MHQRGWGVDKEVTSLMGGGLPLRVGAMQDLDCAYGAAMPPEKPQGLFLG
jgi:hypothetical protein